MSKKNIAIIFAGGTGTRMGAGLPKQFLQINGKPILIHTLDNFQNSPSIDKIYIACKADYIEQTRREVEKYQITKVAAIVPGGNTSQDSIFNALSKAREENSDDSIVLIHDGVRPFLSEEVIRANIESVNKHGSAITCTSWYETVILSENGEKIEQVPSRDIAYTAQAPQSFYLGEIVDAHIETRKINPEYIDIVDSCSLLRKMGKEIYIVKGNRGNIKVTTPEDFYILRALLQYKENEQILGL